MDIGRNVHGNSGIRVEIEPHEYGWVVTCRDGEGRLLYFANAGESEVQARRAARNVARIYNAEWDGRIPRPAGGLRRPPTTGQSHGGVPLR